MTLDDSPLRPGSEVTVVLVKHPRADVRYPAVVVSDDGNHLVVRAPWAGAPTRDMGFVRFEGGDLFTEHYWRDRWYAVKEVRDATGNLKGWYCDVTRPATIGQDMIFVADMELDLWCSATGDILHLDEDEFLASGIPEGDPAAAARARQALKELDELARDGFAAVIGPSVEGS